MIKVNPSKLDLALACPAAPGRNVAFPFVESDASLRGKDLHERTALMIDNPDMELEEICEGLPAEDIQAVKTCVDVANLLMPKGKKRVFIEDKLDLKFISMNTGIPDLAYYDFASKTIAVVDWKFGRGPVPDPSGNHQLMAYALALTNQLKEDEIEVLQAYLVICQPCGTPRESYRDYLAPAQVFQQWEVEIKAGIMAAQSKDALALPGKHCRSMFCEAGKNGVCNEFQAYLEGKTQEREEVKVAEAKFAVSGALPVVVTAEPIQFPVVVISEEAITKANYYRERALMPVTDQGSANTMGLLLNDITKFESQIEKNHKEVKKPLKDLEKLIDEARDRGLIPLREAKVKAKQEIDRYVREQKQIVEEEVRKANAAIAARRMKEEKAAELGQVLEPVAEPILAPRVMPVVIAGVKVKQVPEFEILDFKAMPDTFKLVNEALLKKAIESKGVTEKDTWVKITWVDKSQSSGHR